ncbi:MAG: hypothetical protein K8U03_16305 [Planctomycetia bacterium]|nr:hypothetical protein [Planctomycetia bacterium]
MHEAFLLDMNNSLLIAILQIGPILVGILLGRWLHYLGPPPNLATTSAQIAAALMFVGYCEAKINLRLYIHPRCSQVCGAVFLYSLPIILVISQLSRPRLGDDVSSIVVALIPLPPLFAIPLLVRLKVWRTVAGIVLFEFACYLRQTSF